MPDPYKEVYEDNNDVYEDEAIEELTEEDELSPEEEAFMRGYNKAGKRKKPKPL